MPPVPPATVHNESRQKVITALEEALQKISVERSESKVQRPYDDAHSERLNEVDQTIRKAASDLHFFWTHMQLYSSIELPEYLNVSIHRLKVDSSSCVSLVRTTAGKVRILNQQMGLFYQHRSSFEFPLYWASFEEALSCR